MSTVQVVKTLFTYKNWLQNTEHVKKRQKVVFFDVIDEWND